MRGRNVFEDLSLYAFSLALIEKVKTEISMSIMIKRIYEDHWEKVYLVLSVFVIMNEFVFDFLIFMAEVTSRCYSEKI